MDKLHENTKAVHRQFEADLALGDPKAKAMAGMLRGELNRARESSGMLLLPAASNIWVGSDFPSTRLLILGESTYGTDDPLSTYIPSWCRRNTPDQTFSRIFNAFSGHTASSATIAQREAFWTSIAFANFVEEAVGSERSHRPTPDHYRAAASALPALVRRLKPMGVLILGREQAQHSEPLICAAGILCVVCPHPTAFGVSTATLKSAWNELQSKIRNA
jgi:hypothetical protein